MRTVVLSINVETETKYVEVVETEGDEAYVAIVERVKSWNEIKRGGRTWEILEGVDPKLLDCLWERQKQEREKRTRERDDIKDYFRDALKSIETLEEIWNEKF